MSEQKALLEKIDEVNRGVLAMRERVDANEKSMRENGIGDGTLKGQIKQVQDDLVAAVGTISSLQQAIALANETKSRHNPNALSAEELAFHGAFLKCVRSGDNAQSRMSEAEKKALSAISNPDGGYNVPTDMSGRIISKVQLMSPLRQYANKQTIGTSALEGPIDNQMAEAGWVTEQGARNTTGTPQVGMWRIPVHEMYAKPKATQTLLDDSVVDMDAWLVRKIADRLAQMEAEAFITGDGTGKPRGLLSRTLSTSVDASRTWGEVQYVKTGVNGGFAAAPNGGDALINLITALHPKYWSNARFIMNRYTLGEIMKLKDGEGNYLWMPDFTNGGRGGLLKGFQVDASFDHLATSTVTDSKAILFGDFNEAYQIVDRQGMRLVRDPFSAKPFIEFYTTARVGGDVLNSEAYKVLQFSA